jgi:hypothetical protein
MQRAKRAFQRGMGLRRGILIVLGLGAAAFIAYGVFYSSSLEAIQDDRVAQCYLTALHKELAAYQEAYGHWPTKEEMESHQPRSVICWNDEEDPMPPEVIKELWEECRILQPSNPQDIVAYIPSRVRTHGMKTIEVVHADGSLDRKPAPGGGTP